MHGEVALGGPVWLFATVFILVTLVLAVFVVLDSLRPGRVAAATVREPLWVYTAGEALFLAALALVAVSSGMSLISAVPVVAAPFALALGIAYLLRVVFPKPAEGDLDSIADDAEDASSATL